MGRRQKRGPNITAAAVNTRGKNTSIVVSTKNTSMPLMRTRTANASIATNTGNTNAKRAPLPLVLSSMAPPATEKLNPLPPLEIQVWTTGPCWKIWRNRGPWSKLSWTASWWRARFSQAWVWSFRVITLDLKRMEMLGSEMENSVKGSAQVNPYLPEQEKVGNLDGTQQRAVNPAPGVVVGVSLQTGKDRPRSLSQTRWPKPQRTQALKTEAGAAADQKTESGPTALTGPRIEPGSPTPPPAGEESRKAVALINVPLLSGMTDQTRRGGANDPDQLDENVQVAQMLTETNDQPSPHPRTRHQGKKTAPLTDEGLIAPWENAVLPRATEIPTTPRLVPQTGHRNRATLHPEQGPPPGEAAAAHQMWTGGGRLIGRSHH